jgi:hypothetical protein
VKNKILSYIAIVIILFFTGCGGSSSSIKTALQHESSPSDSHDGSVSGVSSSSEVVAEEKIGAYSLLYPSKTVKKLPVILFLPGWGSQNPNDYRTLIDFMVMEGNIVFFAPEYGDEYGCTHIIEAFETIYQKSKLRSNFDTSRLGVVGHSSGGGKAYRVFDYFTQKGWGKSGSFVLSMAPWFAFDMGEKQMQRLPETAYFMILLFSEDTSTDIRIPMTIYSMLSQVPKNHKTFYIYQNQNAFHNYPNGASALSALEGVTEPLRALIQISFYHESERFLYYDSHGSDQPWSDYAAVVNPSYTYEYDCFADQGAVEDPIYTALFRYGVDYCAIFP